MQKVLFNCMIFKMAIRLVFVLYVIIGNRCSEADLFKIEMCPANC